MTPAIARKTFQVLAQVTLVLLVSLPAARADDPQLLLDPQQQIEDLRRRLEQLEKANEQLRDRQQKADKDAEQKKLDDEVRKKQAEEEFKQVGKDLSMQVRWNNGFEAETANKDFKVRIGGRTQFDTIWMTGADNVQFGEFGTGPIDNGVNFLRARLDVEATMYETLDFYSQFDFLNTFREPDVSFGAVNTPVPTDLWLTVTHLPWLGNLRMGNQKPPISLEHMTSSRFLDFLERSLCFDAFIGGLDNGFVPGFQLFNWQLDERMTWAVGMFTVQNNIFGWNVGDGDWQVCSRFTALPWYEEDGRYLVHLGLGLNHRDPDDGVVNLRARTLLRNGPASLQTVLAQAVMLGRTMDLIVPELAVVIGPFNIQSDFYAVWVRDPEFPAEPAEDRVRRGTAFFYGYYVQALYFLTGEHRVYNRKSYDRRRIATFDRVSPYDNFFLVEREDGGCCFGRGAWQIGARYSFIDLVDNGIFGGIVHDMTLGLNWFWNPNTKLQWNYSLAHRELPVGDSNGFVQGFGMRLAFDF